MRAFFPYLDGTYEQTSYIFGVIPTSTKIHLHDLLRHRARRLKREAVSPPGPKWGEVDEPEKLQSIAARVSRV